MLIICLCIYIIQPKAICVCIYMYVSYISKGTSQLGKHVNGEIKEGSLQFLRKKKRENRKGQEGREGGKDKINCEIKVKQIYNKKGGERKLEDAWSCQHR